MKQKQKRGGVRRIMKTDGPEMAAKVKLGFKTQENIPSQREREREREGERESERGTKRNKSKRKMKD